MFARSFCSACAKSSSFLLCPLAAWSDGIEGEVSCCPLSGPGPGVGLSKDDCGVCSRELPVLLWWPWWEPGMPIGGLLTPVLFLKNLKNPVSDFVIVVLGEAGSGEADGEDMDLCHPTSARRPEASRLRAASSISVLDRARAKFDCVTRRVVSSSSFSRNAV